MMKSFFKKLAFVMALAMVVSMVAPAGAVFAAEAGVSLQGTKVIVETYELDKVGATVDFSFQGAPKDWKTTSKWASSNTAVATVDQNGVVTAVAAGTATISITAGADASYVETVVVTVKEAAKAFVVEQADLTHFTMTFGAKKDVKAEDVAVVLMINDVEAPIPVKAVTVAENVATVELFSEFIDGITYKVTYGKESQSFVGSIGAIDKVAFTYYTDKKDNKVAYVSTEEEPSVATLVYSLYDANGVDVTSAYKEDELTIEYSIVNESDDFEVIDNELVFYEAGAAVVEVKVSWTSEEGDEIEKVGNGVVVATKRPAIAHNLVKAGFITPSTYNADPAGATAAFVGNPDAIMWKNNEFKTSWTLGDAGTFQFAAVVKDNRGNTVATGINDYGTVNWVNEDGEEVYPYGYFKFVTSNDDVVDVDEEGLLSFWGAGSASIITYFVDTTGEEEKEVFVGATKLTVSPERYPATYAVSTTSATVASKTIGGGNDADFVLAVFDQYGKNIVLKNGANDIKVETTSTAEDIPVKEVSAVCSEGRFSWGSCTGWWCGGISKGGVHYHIIMDGDAYAEYLGTKTSKTVQYAITVDKDENPKITTPATTKIKVTVKDTEDYAGLLSAFVWGGEKKADKFYYNVGGGANVDVAIKYAKNFKLESDDTKKEVKSKDISMNYLNTTNGFTMGAVPSKNIVAYEKDQTTGEIGKLYYEVSTPKDAKNYSVTPADGKITLKWNDTTDGDLNYATTGAYKVTVYYVKNTSSDKLSKLGTYTYNVTNSQADPKFAGYDSKLGNKAEAGTDVDDAIMSNLVFTLDGNKITWENGFKFEYELGTDVVVTDKKIRVNELTITVPVDDGNNATDYTYTKKIKIGKTIYFKDAE